MHKTKWFRAVAFDICCTPLFLLAGFFLNYLTIPTHNSSLTHFDAIIVLGTPAKADGTPGDEAAQRTQEAIAEYRRGVASHLILTGGKAHNQFIEEGQAMANFAAAQGVPLEALVVEGKATDTITNIYYSEKIMEERGWKSAEVVSSPSHLPRAALILEHQSFPWKTHKSGWPAGYTWERVGKLYWGEAMSCWKLRMHGFPHSKYIPGT